MGKKTGLDPAEISPAQILLSKTVTSEKAQHLIDNQEKEILRRRQLLEKIVIVYLLFYTAL